MFNKEGLLSNQKIMPMAFAPVEQRVLLGRRTVLLAEDDDDLRCVMEQTFNAMGYLVAACPNAERALDTFKSSRHFDVLVTDFQMPGKSGIELARELTALRPQLPVVIITGTTLSSSAMHEIRERQWVYVSKPCDLSSLRSTLERFAGISTHAA